MESNIKLCTDLKQSEKLKKILPLETADMHYSTWTILDDGEFILSPNQGCKIEDLQEDYGNQIIPCWSLASLRACLPPGINIDGILYVFESHNTFDNEWVYEYKYEDISAPLYSKSSNEIDACYELIIKLNEQKFL